MNETIFPTLDKDNPYVLSKEEQAVMEELKASFLNSVRLQRHIRFRKSPLSGRNVKTFERTFLQDHSTWTEENNPYYCYHEEEKTCNMILCEFGLYTPMSHIMNGHTPVRTAEGEQPCRTGK